MKKTPFLSWFSACAVASATVVGQLDRVGLNGFAGWACDLFAHWPRQLFLIGLIVTLTSAARKMLLPTTLAATASIINAVVLLNTTGFALPQPVPSASKFLRVISANVHRSHAALEKIADVACEYQADFIAIYETPENLSEIEVKKLFPSLKFIYLPTKTPEGVRLFKRSLVAMREDVHRDFAITYFQASNGVVMRLSYADVIITIAHPPSPGTPRLADDRNQQLRHTALSLDTSAPFIIMGDFNTSPWTTIYAQIPGERAGDPRLEASFPAFAGIFGLPIDHIKFGGGLTLTDYRVGPDILSDHLPIRATFSLPESGSLVTKVAPPSQCVSTLF